jgi:hypothetical protein
MMTVVCSAGVGRSGSVAALLAIRQRVSLPMRHLELLAKASNCTDEVGVVHIL